MASDIVLGARSFPVKGQFINSSSGLVSGAFYTFQVMTEAVLQSISMESGFTGASKVAGQTLPAGLLVQINFTAIQVASGVLLIYDGTP